MMPSAHLPISKLQAASATSPKSSTFLDATEAHGIDCERASLHLAASSKHSNTLSSKSQSREIGDSDDTHIAIDHPPRAPPSLFSQTIKPTAGPRGLARTATQDATTADERQQGKRSPGIRVLLRAAHTHIWQLDPYARPTTECPTIRPHDQTRHHRDQLLRGVRGR